MRAKIKREFIGPLAGVICVGTSVLSSGATEEKLTVAALPPSVVKTHPAAGSTDVDPAITEIRVTFSKEMMTERMWAVVQTSREHFPKLGKGIHYRDDRRTCIIPVSLKPGKTYVLWFNKGKYNTFRDIGNRPAVPYQLVFQTKEE